MPIPFNFFLGSDTGNHFLAGVFLADAFFGFGSSFLSIISNFAIIALSPRLLPNLTKVVKPLTLVLLRPAISSKSLLTAFLSGKNASTRRRAESDPALALLINLS